MLYREAAEGITGRRTYPDVQSKVGAYEGEEVAPSASV